MTVTGLELVLRALAGQDKFLTVSIPKIFLDTFNKDMNTAMIFMELVGHSPKADNEGWFSIPMKEWTAILPLSKYQVTRSVDVLKNMGILSTEVRQVDSIPKLHYKLHFEIVYSLLREPIEMLPAIPMLPKPDPNFGVRKPVNRPKVKLLNFGNSPINGWGLKWVPRRGNSKKQNEICLSIDKNSVINYYNSKSIPSVLSIDILYINNIRNISKRNIINYIPFINIPISDPINGWGFEPLPIQVPHIYTFLKKDLKKGMDVSVRTYSFIGIPPMKKTDKVVPSKVIPKKKHIVDKSLDPIIIFWNTLPGVRIHKDTSTKTYIKAKKKLNQLRQGKFRYNRFDGQFLKSKGITKEIIGRTYTDMEIREILKEVSKMFLSGYWPENKDWLPKDLSSLLFNERRNNSWFLACAAVPVETLDDSTCRSWLENLDKEDRDTFKDFVINLELTQGYKIPEREYPVISSIIIEIQKYYNHLKTVMMSREREEAWLEFERWFPSKYHLVIKYSEWIQEFYETSNDFSYHWIKTSGSVWKRYVKTLFSDLGLEEYLGEAF